MSGVYFFKFLKVIFLLSPFALGEHDDVDIPMNGLYYKQL